MNKIFFIYIFVSIIFSSSINQNQIDTIYTICSNKNYTQSDLVNILKNYNVNSITDLSEVEGYEIIATLDPNLDISNSKTTEVNNNTNFISKLKNKTKNTFLNINPRKSKFSRSIGINENLGGHGGLSFKYNINDYLYFIGGTSIIIGGAGLGIRYSPNIDRVSPFISSSIFKAYTIPLMCENCDGFIYNNYLTTSLGLDVLAFQTKKNSYHIQLGILTYLYSQTINRNKSRNNKTEPILFINIKITQ